MFFTDMLFGKFTNFAINEVDLSIQVSVIKFLFGTNELDFAWLSSTVMENDCKLVKKILDDF